MKSPEFWDRVQTDYVAGMSLRELAAKHDVSKSAIAKRAVEWKVDTEKVDSPEVDTVTAFPQPVDSGAKWQPKLGCFVSKVIDGKFTCLKCGYRDEDLSGHECAGKDTWTGENILPWWTGIKWGGKTTNGST